jgi:hypothetical protein
MTQNAKVDKVLNTILVEKDDNEIEKRCITLNKNELAQLILFLINTKSLKVELAALLGTNEVVKDAKTLQDTEATVTVTRSPRAQVCKAFHNGQVCPDQVGCLFEHPEVCDRPECKTRRSENCTSWHPPLCKSFKRLTHCMNGDACTARHPATCTTKDCSFQSGCALWHTKTPRSRDPKVIANSGKASRRTQARRSDSSRAKSGVKGKGTYVTRQLAENLRMREKIATLEQKQVQFCPQLKDFPPLQPQQVRNSQPAPLHSFPWFPPAPSKGLVPPGPLPDISALFAALLPLQAALQAFLPR